MATLISSNQSNSDTSQQRKKRRKLTHETTVSQTPNDTGNNQRAARWRADTVRRIYSRKLLDALHQSCRRNSSLPAEKSREVRETADRVLAVAAKGRTRWSRAILAKRARLLRVKKVNKPKAPGDRMLPEKEKRRNLPAVEKRVKVLSRLVPGCRKASFESLLEEASDYIAALEMQVKAMTALSEILAAANGGAGSGGSSSSEVVNEVSSS